MFGHSVQWVAEHRTIFIILTVALAFLLKFEHRLPRKLNAVLFVLDLCVCISAALSEVLHERLNETWKRDTSQNVNQAASAANSAQREAKIAQPREQPIALISASAEILIGGRPPFPYLDHKDTMGRVASLYFGEFERFKKRLGPWVIVMVSDKVEWWSSTTEAEYFLDFRLEPVAFGPLKESSAGELIDHVDLFRLNPVFLPPNTEIAGGYIILTVNSVVQKRFSITPQNTGLFNEIADDLPRVLTPTPSSTP
jgi:hypothetical protein